MPFTQSDKCNGVKVKPEGSRMSVTCFAGRNGVNVEQQACQMHVTGFDGRKVESTQEACEIPVTGFHVLGNQLMETQEVRR